MPLYHRLLPHAACSIKQGCTLLPAMFSILLAGMHHYLESKVCAEMVPTIAVNTFPALSYADNIILSDNSLAALAQKHAWVQGFITMIPSMKQLLSALDR